MSSRYKKKGQKYQNTFSFKHNPHSILTEKILSSPNEGVCQNCYDRIEWKKKYRKYKPLSVPKKWFEKTENFKKLYFTNLVLDVMKRKFLLPITYNVEIVEKKINFVQNVKKCLFGNIILYSRKIN